MDKVLSQPQNVENKPQKCIVTLEERKDGIVAVCECCSHTENTAHVAAKVPEEIKPSQREGDKGLASTKNWRPLTPPHELSLATSSEDSESDEETN